MEQVRLHFVYYMHQLIMSFLRIIRPNSDFFYIMDDGIYEIQFGMKFRLIAPNGKVLFVDLKPHLNKMLTKLLADADTVEMNSRWQKLHEPAK